MSAVVEAASFAWRLTVTGAEAVKNAFTDIGKSSDTALKNIPANTNNAAAGILNLTTHLEGMAKQAEGLEKLKNQLIAIAAVGGTAELIKSSLELASSYQQLAADTGFSTKSVQELTYALGQFNVKQDVAKSGMKDFSAVTAQFVEHNAGPAKQAYETLFGANAQQVAQKGLQNVDQFFVQVLDRIGKLKNTAQQVELARELFGRGAGSELLTAAQAGAASIEALREEAEKLGIVFTDDMINKSNDAADRIDALGTVLHTQLAMAIDENADKIGAFAEAAIKATPAVVDGFTLIKDVVTNVRDAIAAIAVSIEDVFLIANNGLQKLNSAMESIGGPIRNFLVEHGLTEDTGKTKAAEPAAPGWLDGTANPLDAFDGNTGITAFDDKPVAPPSAKPHSSSNAGGGSLKIGDDAAVNAAKAQADAYDKLTYSLQQQVAAMGTSDREMFINTQTRKLGATATQTQRDNIAALAGTLYDEQQAWAHTKEAMSETGQAFSQFFTDAISGAKNLKSAVSDLAGALESMMMKLFVTDKIEDYFKNAMSGSSGGGGFGSLFSSIGSTVSNLLHFANGGEFNVGGIGGTDSQLVSFWASPDENVSVTRPGQGGGGSKGDVYNIDARGADQAAIARLEAAITAVNGSIEKRALGAYYNEVRRNPSFA